MYDDIASLYHLIYQDWQTAINDQGKAYFGLAETLLGSPPERVLDISCGIGTQSLGLAALGADVVASDLSTAAVSRATREAEQRGLNISFSAADMRHCFRTHGGEFDLVLSADNSLPHLDREGVQETLAEIYRCLKPGGVALLGVRDYKPDEDRGTGQVFPYGAREFDDERFVIFQTRDWEGDQYEVGMYFVREMTDDKPAAVIAGKSRYFAIATTDLMQALEAEGFIEVQRHDRLTHNVLISARKTV